MNAWCATCRYWDQDDVHDAEWDRPSDWGLCQRTSTENGGNHPIKDGVGSLALASAEYDYRAVLRTRHDFGCVQFQQKPPVYVVTE